MRSWGVVLACSVAVGLAGPAWADGASAPILGPETPAGTHRASPLPAAPAGPRTVDGSPGDWSGTAAGFGGASLVSRGELVYTDHLFDAYGADDGRDRDRLEKLDPVYSNVPESYRLEPLLQYGGSELGLPLPEQFNYQTHFGDLEMQDRADLTEFRLGADASKLWLLARTTTMTAESDAAVLVLLDTVPGDAEHTVPFGSGLHTSRADHALLLAGDRGWRADLATGEVTELEAGSVATDPSGWTNTVEAAVDRSLLGAADGRSIGVAVATGRADAEGDGLANVANVAFRAAEPVRENWDKLQALALLDGTIDAFFAGADLGALQSGASERWTPTTGFHERVFRSTESVARESGEDGILQPYGVWIPSAYEPGSDAPLQLWLHWRGGNHNSVGNVAPRALQDLGEARGALVVSPRGRGSASWYVGRGQVDLEDVWRDVHETFSVDRARTYVAGHSMGGWGSFLQTIIHPDWFAAALPASPPVTQGAWTGVDFENCDEYSFDEYSPCYIQANGGDARAEHTRRLLDNVRHVPYAMYAGVEDELVPFTGVALQGERLRDLGYRYRLYAFTTQEHYGPPIWDQWGEGARYMDRFTRPENPARVTYKRDMPFERAVERVNSGGVELDFSFDHAYWMSGLRPADPVDGVARVDARSLAIADEAPLVAPDAGGPAAPDNTGPYVMTGQQWLDDPLATAAAVRNAFTATLDGATAVTLDGSRMRLDAGKVITGTVVTDTPVELTLTGDWRGAPRILLDGLPAAAATRGDKANTVTVPAGTHTVAYRP
jgi:hypothetical protein